MKYLKRISALVCVFVLCFAMMAQPAHAIGALGGQQFGAWIAAGLVSLNIVANTALQSQPVQAIWNWCSSPTAEDRINYLFPNTGQKISDYMNAATIKVSKGVTTIDGVEYDELWVSPDTFSNGLKTNLFDFKTKWNILSGQSNITLATGSGFLNGQPMYNVGGNIRSPNIEGEGNFGGYAVSFPVFNNSVRARVGDWTSSNGLPDYYTYSSHYFTTDKGNVYIYWTGTRYTTSKFTQNAYVSGLNFNYQDTPFEFTYTSGIVPGESSEIPDDYGLAVRIPHEKLETFYNAYPQYNVDNTTINVQEDNVDIDELTQAIFDMIDSMEDIKAEWTSGEEPEPPVPVDPIENIDQNVSDITQYQQAMEQNVSHMHQDVEGIHETQIQQQQIQQQMQQTQQEMQQTQQDISEHTESIKDSIDNITQTPGTEDLPRFKFDLRELFPFCIPFDIYRLLQKFDGTPTAPHVQLPFVIGSIGFSYMLDLDFSAFDSVAQVMRTMEFIVYAIALAWATSKVIKW